MRIGLLFGGKSFEHDISIITASIIYNALKEKYDVELLYIDKKGTLRNPKKLVIDDLAQNTQYRGFKFINQGIIRTGIKRKIDVMINATHGINGEDGLGAMIANLYNIPYVGANHISSGLLMDKYFTYAVLRSLDIKTLDAKFYLNGEKIEEEKFPLIIKPARLGSSIGISKVNNFDELSIKTKEAFMFDDKVIIQPYILEFKEYNQAAYLWDGQIITSSVEEVFKSEDILSFDDKYLHSKTNKKHAFITDSMLIDKITNLTKKIYQCLELSGIVRIDYMYIDDEVYVNEINTTPGSLSYYLFDENILTLLEKQIKMALILHQNKKDTTFSSSVLSQNYSIKK